MINITVYVVVITEYVYELEQQCLVYTKSPAVSEAAQQTAKKFDFAHLAESITREQEQRKAQRLAEQRVSLPCVNGFR